MKSTFNNILNDVIDMAEETKPYSKISIGSNPPKNGLAMILSTGFPELTDFEKGLIGRHSILLNGKHSKQDKVYDAICKIHEALTRIKKYPNNDVYQILDISSTTYPTLIDREDNGQYIYGSALEVKFYWKK